MKKIFLSFTVLVVLSSCVFAFFGCSLQYEFVNSSYPIEIFDLFDNEGGSLKKIKAGPTGVLELTYSFETNNVNITDKVKKINIDLVGEDSYNNGKRVIEIKNTKKNNNGFFVSLFTDHVNKLRSKQIKLVTNVDYQNSPTYQDNGFVTPSKKSMEIQDISSSQTVLLVNGLRNGVAIEALGKIQGVSNDGVAKLSSNSVVFSKDSGAVILRQSRFTAIFLISLGIFIVLAVVFIILIKCRVFTAVTVNKAKKNNH